MIVIMFDDNITIHDDDITIFTSAITLAKPKIVKDIVLITHLSFIKSIIHSFIKSIFLLPRIVSKISCFVVFTFISKGDDRQLILSAINLISTTCEACHQKNTRSQKTIWNKRIAENKQNFPIFRLFRFDRPFRC